MNPSGNVSQFSTHAASLALYRSVASRLPGVLRTNSRPPILNLWCPRLANHGFGSVPRLREPIFLPSGICGNREQKREHSRFHQPNLIPDGTTTTGGWYGLFLISIS